MTVDLVVHLDKKTRLGDAVADGYDGSTNSYSTTMSTETGLSRENAALLAGINNPLGRKIDTVNSELAKMNHRATSP